MKGDKKANTISARLKKAANLEIFSLEVKNKKTERLVFLFFVLVCSAFVLGFYKLDLISFKYLIVTYVIFLGLWLYHFFQPDIITKMIFISLFLLAPVVLYLEMWQVSQKESKLFEGIINEAAPQFIDYQYYILLMTYTVFEVAIQLLSLFFKKIREKIKKNPYTIRLSFIIILGIIRLLMDLQK